MNGSTRAVPFACSPVEERIPFLIHCFIQVHTTSKDKRYCLFCAKIRLVCVRCLAIVGSSGCCIPRVPASSVRSFPDPSAHQAHKNEDHDEARFNFSHDADSVPNGFARSTTVRSHSQTKKWVRIFVCPTSIFRFALRIN